MRPWIILISVLGIVALFSRPAAGDLPEVVSRYVDDTTLIVGRIDLQELRSEAIVAFLNDLLREAPGWERQELIDATRQGLAQMEETLAPLRERGVTIAWFVMGPSSFVQQEGALTIVPAEDDEQAKAVTDLLMRGREEHLRVAGAVLIGQRPVLEAARHIQPVERPVLARPFSRLRAAPALQIVMEPTPLVRIAIQFGMGQVAQQMQLPAEAVELAGVMESLNFVLNLPPAPRGAVVIDFPDAGAADQAREVLEGQVKRLEQQFRRGGIEPPQARELTEAFLPEVRDRRVVMELTPEELRETVGPVMVITMMRGREGALRVRTGRNLRTLAQAIILWSYEHGEGRLPTELALVEQVFTDPQVDGATWRSVRRNPRYNADDAFAYVRPADRLDQIAEPDITVIAYEKPPAEGIREGVNVAFADGRVEWLTAADFEELAAAQGFAIERLGRR